MPRRIRFKIFTKLSTTVSELELCDKSFVGIFEFGICHSLSHNNSFLSLTFLTRFFGLVPRFGEALSKSRSLHAKRNLRRAKRFVRDARRSTRNFDLRPRVNRAWIAGANLQPVLNFLAGK